MAENYKIEVNGEEVEVPAPFGDDQERLNDVVFEIVEKTGLDVTELGALGPVVRQLAEMGHYFGEHGEYWPVMPAIMRARVNRSNELELSI